MEVRPACPSELPDDADVAVVYTATDRLLLVRQDVVTAAFLAQLADALAPC